MNNYDQKAIFATNLQRILEEKRLQQVEVAAAIHVPVQTFNNWMKANTFPRSEKLQALAGFLGVRVSELVDPQLPESRISKLSAMMEAHPIYWEVMDAVSGMDEEGLRLAIRLLRTMKEAGNE